MDSTTEQLSFKEFKKKFGKDTKLLSEQVAYIMDLVRPKIDKDWCVQRPDGIFMTRELLFQIQDKLVKDISDIPKKVSTARKRNTTGAPQGTRNGNFSRPCYVKKSVIDFVKEADFGQAYEVVEGADGEATYQPTGKPLKTYLTKLMAADPVTTVGILTSLIAIYERLNKNTDPAHKGRVVPTRLMIKHFGRIFEEIAEDDRKKGVIKPFNPQSFNRPRHQTLFARCVDKERVKANKIALSDPRLKEQIEEEQRIASETCAALRHLDEMSKAK